MDADRQQHVAAGKRRAAILSGTKLPRQFQNEAAFNAARRAVRANGGERAVRKFDDENAAERERVREQAAAAQPKLAALPSDKVRKFSIGESSFTAAGRSVNGFERFRKTVLRSGKWKHPELDYAVDATADFMTDLVRNFQRLKWSVDVFVPIGHDRNPAANAGFVTDLQVARGTDGKSELVAVLDIVDPALAAKIRQGAVRGVSVAIDGDFRVSHADGRVEKVGNFIEHVALTMTPVVTGLGEFVPLT